MPQITDPRQASLLCVQVQRIRLRKSYLPVSNYAKELKGQTDFQDGGKKGKKIFFSTNLILSGHHER